MRSKFMKTNLRWFSILLVAATIGCSHTPPPGTEAKYPDADRDELSNPNKIYDQPQGIFGGAGLNLFGHKKEADAQTGIGVNSYLWRAALDTVSFMPLASADPFGGVILTDWFAPPSTPLERYKLNVFIMDKQLRSDGIQVKVFKQIKRGSTWQDTTVDPAMGPKIEDAILTRARQLRVASMGNQ